MNIVVFKAGIFVAMVLLSVNAVSGQGDVDKSSKALSLKKTWMAVAKPTSNKISDVALSINSTVNKLSVKKPVALNSYRVLLPNGKVLQHSLKRQMFLSGNNIVSSKIDHATGKTEVDCYDAAGRKNCHWELDGFRVRYLTKNGYVITINNLDGLGTKFRVLTLQGKLVREIIPFKKSVFNDYVILEKNTKILFVAHENINYDAKKTSNNSSIIIFNTKTNNLDLEMVAPLSVQSGELGEEYFVLHNNYVENNRHISQLITYSISGKLFGTFDTYVHEYLFHEKEVKIYVAGKKTLKKVNPINGTPDWTLSYDSLLKKPITDVDTVYSANPISKRIMPVSLDYMSSNKNIVLSLSGISHLKKSEVVAGLIDGARGVLLNRLEIIKETQNLRINKLSPDELSFVVDSGIYVVDLVDVTAGK